MIAFPDQLLIFAGQVQKLSAFLRSSDECPGSKLSGQGKWMVRFHLVAVSGRPFPRRACEAGLSGGSDGDFDLARVGAGIKDRRRFGRDAAADRQ